MRTPQQQRARQELASAWRWIRSHGRNLDGYIARYGSHENPKHGDGGPAIFIADLDALREAYLHAVDVQAMPNRFPDIRTMASD